MKIKQMGYILALAMGSSAANATTVTLYDHLTGLTETGAAAVPPGHVSTAFTTGSLCSTGCTLGNITLRMFLDSGADTSDITLGLYSDAGSAPGTLLTTLANPGSIDDDFTNAVFSAQGQTTLNANTTYWLRLSADGNSDGGEWGYSFGSGALGNYILPNGHSGSGSPFLYRVDAEVSNVPVPASVWLMLTGLTGLVARSRRASA